MFFLSPLTLAAAAVAVSLASGPLAAKACAGPNQIIDGLASGGVQKVADLRGDEAIKFIDNFNKLSPPTLYIGDRVLIFYRTPMVISVIFSGGCYLTHATFSQLIFKGHFPKIDIHGREVDQ